MTEFHDLERGDVVWGTDPLSDKGRPMLVLGTPRLPNHGLQLITVLISTKTYHEESLTLRDDDYEGDPLGERSHALPWSLATLNSAAEVEFYMPSLVDERVADVTTRSTGYISS
ncbi:PemK-like protein [Halolamina salifodinae]|uniref:mRNA-degrading endonuclease toxin of MazEF toxin-antitoxin module n=1 Tax=Halolamina salifodinae TaxID=1202767 RepID=A0A8T4H2Y2_9EURY|nr:PemK-like protein [Halolamina salifodinae]MBP1987985.1 mRNA-degrading endonuclease toxin of MazEF toxin-antitoxin module [Halolamina salifodinae]